MQIKKKSNYKKNKKYLKKIKLRIKKIVDFKRLRKTKSIYRRIIKLKK